MGIGTQGVFLDIETDRTGDGIGDHQRRRGQKRLLGVRVDAAVEISVARKHGGGIKITIDDFLLDCRIEGAAHAVAGGAGESDDAESEFLEIVEQTGLLQIQLDDFGTRRQ